MVKLKLELAQGPQAINLPFIPRLVALPVTMQATVKEKAKVASTVKIPVCSQNEANGLLAYGIIVAGKRRPVDRHYDIASDTECPTCAK